MLAFAIPGFGCIAGGGLVAAAIAPAPTEHGAWAVAYLVLVGGIAQLALGAGQALLAVRTPSPATIRTQVVGWNAGNAVVIAGTLANLTVLTGLGAAVLVVVLALFVFGVRGGAAGNGTGDSPDAARRPDWLLHGFRTLVVVLLVSIPIGLVLSHLRHG